MPTSGLYCGVLLLFLVVSGGIAQTQTAPAASGAGYVGSNACRTCHADIWQNFYRNPHYKSIASGKEPPEKTGCEGCHGPAAERTWRPAAERPRSRTHSR